MNNVIGAIHEFHDEQYVTDWSNRFTPTHERVRLFDMIVSEVSGRVPADGCIVELGTGPGYLASHLLARLPKVRYYAIDFSEPMFAITWARLTAYASRVHYVHANLVTDPWWTLISEPVDAVVSTWALHDLGGSAVIGAVYQGCARLLRPGGLLLNGDFIKPDHCNLEFEPGRFETSLHLQLLGQAGFNQTECMALFETELESPASPHNYACFRAVR